MLGAAGLAGGVPAGRGAAAGLLGAAGLAGPLAGRGVAGAPGFAGALTPGLAPGVTTGRGAPGATGPGRFAANICGFFLTALVCVIIFLYTEPTADVSVSTLRKVVVKPCSWSFLFLANGKPIPSPMAKAITTKPIETPIATGKTHEGKVAKPPRVCTPNPIPEAWVINPAFGSDAFGTCEP